MDTSLPVWLLPLLSFIVGLFAGLLFSRTSSSKESGAPDNRLNELQDRFDNYQDEVIAHFSTTADLVNKLSENYQNVQEHLVQSAERLALDDETRQELLNRLVSQKALEQQPCEDSQTKEPGHEEDAEGTAATESSAPVSDVEAVSETAIEAEAPAPVAPRSQDDETDTSSDELPEQPRDYANKQDGEVGTLDENFGLKKD